jgi:hypothetical protein
MIWMANMVHLDTGVLSSSLDLGKIKRLSDLSDGPLVFNIFADPVCYFFSCCDWIKNDGLKQINPVLDRCLKQTSDSVNKNVFDDLFQIRCLNQTVTGEHVDQLQDRLDQQLLENSDSSLTGFYMKEDSSFRNCIGRLAYFKGPFKKFFYVDQQGREFDQDYLNARKEAFDSYLNYLHSGDCLIPMVENCRCASCWAKQSHSKGLPANLIFLLSELQRWLADGHSLKGFRFQMTWRIQNELKIQFEKQLSEILLDLSVLAKGNSGSVDEKIIQARLKKSSYDLSFAEDLHQEFANSGQRSV